MSSTSTPRRNLKRTRSVSTFPNSSDTEYSPPKKMSRRERERSRRVTGVDCDLVELFRYRLCNSSNHEAITSLKSMNNRDQDIICATHKIVDGVKATVKDELHRRGKMILQVELYLKWLEGISFVPKAIEVILGAKVPGTRRRVPGLGRVSFSMLYHLLNTFMDEVNAHQDRWSFRYPAGPVEDDPLIMSLVEESNDSSTDGRSEDAVKRAEGFFGWFDDVLVASVGRYEGECDRRLMGGAIGRKEESLGRGCCLLSEQTGFGGTEGVGFRLFVKSREAMSRWRTEICDDDEEGF